MRKLENRSTTLTNVNSKGEVFEMKYSDIIELCTNTPPKEGFSVSEMKKRLDVQGQLDASKEEILLEEDLYSVVKDCVVNFRWGKVDPQIVEFTDYIEKIEKVNP